MKFTVSKLRQLWSSKSNCCPVCGFSGLHKPAYDSESGLGSAEICPCCEFEFEDHYDTYVHGEFRDRWISCGMPWSGDEHRKPRHWDPAGQLAGLLRLAAATFRNVHNDVAAAIVSLTTALQESAQMAGTDDTAKSWSDAYDWSVAAVLEAASIAVLTTADLVEQLEPESRRPARLHLTPVPRAYGSSQPKPKFAKGTGWPNGDPDRLAAAAKAWKDAATSLHITDPPAQHAIDMIAAQPDSATRGLVTRARTVANQLTAVSNQFAELSRNCHDFGRTISDAQAKIRREHNATVAADAQVARLKFLPERKPIRLGRRILIGSAIVVMITIGRLIYALHGTSVVTANIGEQATIEYRDKAATVIIGGWHWAEGSSLFPPKGRLIVVDVTITAANGGWTVNPLYFSARTKQGDELQPSIFNPDPNDLRSEDLQKGKTVRGTIAFDVPNGATIDTIEISGTFGHTVGVWKVGKPTLPA
ncbi:DUF4352 domain-containing protein [Smaragdicoccus niigatensis]|uniref:WXG100-like domain-containing protein n=1 Tax=Smaragdicoccus niigatensis TaxID=359359 RepID=UPI000371E40D|nr:DUF4352 domain-containing protein [Smaragdicoccus niigatensis]